MKTAARNVGRRTMPFTWHYDWHWFGPYAVVAKPPDKRDTRCSGYGLAKPGGGRSPPDANGPGEGQPRRTGCTDRSKRNTVAESCWLVPLLTLICARTAHGLKITLPWAWKLYCLLHPSTPTMESTLPNRCRECQEFWVICKRSRGRMQARSRGPPAGPLRSRGSSNGRHPRIEQAALTWISEIRLHGAGRSSLLICNGRCTENPKTIP